jgi:membrane fusion protein (multidrug efflux system)
MADIETPDQSSTTTPPPLSRRRPPQTKRGKLLRAVLLLAVLIIVAVGGYFAWKYFSAYESTDDAQVDGHIDAISARINGYVLEVPVEDETIVKAGDVLARIDPKDYEVAVANAEADLASAEANLLGSRTDVPITTTNTDSQLKNARSGRVDTDAALLGAERQLSAAEARLVNAQAEVREAEATYKKDADDEARYKLLVAKDEIPRQTYDTSVHVADAAKADVDARRAAVNEAEQNVRVAQTAIEQANARITQADATIQAALTAPQQVAVSQARAKSSAAQVAQRRAIVEQARLNLSYCTIFAPASGIIGKKTGEVGSNVSPGQQLMALVPLDDIWITADFKETQLRLMKPGQRVTFTVDAYGREYNGKVTGVAGASGSRLSLLPPENATGNYVKVVQRLPVRIDINPGENNDHRLRPGMSVVPKVYVK